MKRIIYILSFTVLGVLLGFLLHAFAEMAYLSFLLSDFGRYGLGLTWGQWYAIHAGWTVLCLLVGIAFGLEQGLHWWRVLYVEGRYNNRLRRPLRQTFFR